VGWAAGAAARALIGSRPRPVVIAVVAREAAFTKSLREMDPSSFIPGIVI
jgi:hypothetical protein